MTNLNFHAPFFLHFHQFLLVLIFQFFHMLLILLLVGLKSFLW